MRPVVGADDRGAALYSSLCKLYYQFRGTYPSECLQFGATIIIHHFPVLSTSHNLRLHNYHLRNETVKLGVFVMPGLLLDTENIVFTRYLRYAVVWLCPIVMFITMQALIVDGYVR